MQVFQSFWQDYKPHFQATLSLSIPVMVGQLGTILMTFIDNLMIGDISYVHLSAASLGHGMFIIIAILGVGLTMALSPLVAEAHGANDLGRCDQYLKGGLAVGIGSGLFLGLLVYLSAYLLPYMGQPAEDVRLAQPYLKILGLATVPMLLFLVLKHFSDGLSLTRVAMYITLIGLCFNTFANWLLIYGKWGLPRLELTGAGIGTFLSRMLMFVLMAMYIAWNRKFKYFQPFSGWSKDLRSIIRRILKVGIPSGLQFFFEVGAFVGAALMVGWLGSAERAAHQIVIQMAAVTFMVVSGIAAGSAIRVGNSLGRKDRLGVRQSGLAGIYLSVIFMLFSGIAFVLGRNILPHMFVDEVFVLEIASQLMLLAGFFQLFDGVQAVGIGILRGIQDVRIPTVFAFISYWLVNLPLGYVLGFLTPLGIWGVWFAFIVSLGLASYLMVNRFLKMTSIQEPVKASF
ncbi:MAG: MATE family efflux transporter [Bacteroidota bacterium]